MTLADLQGLVSNVNVAAMLRVIRARESNQTDDAYRMISGGGLIDLSVGWVHPWDGVPTSQGGKACGAYQFLGTTWHALVAALPGGDFSPPWQDLRCVQLIAEKPTALKAILAGDILTAILALNQIWVSLPGGSQNHNYTVEQALAVYSKYGGQSAASEPAPQPATPTPAASPQPTGASVDPLTLIGIFGSVLTNLLPMVGTLFGGKKDAQNLQVIGTVLDTIAKTHTGDPAATANVENIGSAVQAMNTDPAVKQQITQAVVTHPDIMPLISIEQAMKVDAADNAARVEGMNAAMERQKNADQVIVRRVVDDISTTKKLIIAGIGIGIIVAAIMKGMFPDMPDYVTTLIALGGPVIGSAMKESGAVVAYYFDGTPSNNAANLVNAQTVSTTANKS